MGHLEAKELAALLISLGLLIGVARLLGELARRYHQPAILGELIAGVLLGPTVFGKLDPKWQALLFPAEGKNAIALQGIGTLAIVLFMLVAGMEVDLSVVWKQGRSALKVGVCGVIVPFVIGLIAAYLMPGALGCEPGADPVIFTLFFATAMSISALPVIVKTLMDLNLYRTDLGMVVVSAAMFDDLTGWTIFAIILGMISAEGSGSVAMTITLTLVYGGLVLTVGRWLVHRTLPFLQAYAQWPAGVLGFIVCVGLFGAAFTELIGIHAIFGSFMVGVAMGASPHLQERTRMMLDEFVSFIFAPIFFASIGLKVNFITNFDPMLVLLVLLVACLGKFAGAILGGSWGGFPQRERWAIGFAMNARGAMEIILGLLALQAGVIEDKLFVALVVTAIVTSAISGPLIRWVLKERQPHHLLPLLSSKLFNPKLSAHTNREAIHELVLLACENRELDNEMTEDLAWNRERMTATGIGHGVALPHARIANLEEPVVVVGLSEAGIDFDAPDDRLAHAIFLLLTPLEDPAVQLDLSANIAQMFRDPQMVRRVMQVENFTEFLAVLKTVEPRGT